MTEVLFRDHSHPDQGGGVKGWISEVDDSSGVIVAQVALSKGVTHPDLAEKASGYRNLNITIPLTPEIPEADGLMLASFAGDPDGQVEIIYRLLSGERELHAKRPEALNRIIVGLVAVTLMACRLDASRAGMVVVDDEFVDRYAGRWVEL